MRTPTCLILAAMAALLVHAPGRAQSATLLLTPGPTATVRLGSGTSGFAGDGGGPLAASFASPAAMAQDSQGNFYIADTRNHRIRRVSAGGAVTTIAGTGTQGFSGDGGPAIAAQLDSPAGLALTKAGELYIADTHNQRVRKIDTQGNMQTVAGGSTAGFRGDGGPASAASLSSPQGLAFDSVGNLYIADTANHRIRRIETNGTIATVAGSGVQGKAGDEGPALLAALNAPAQVAIRDDGALFIADKLNDSIRVVTTDGVIHTFSTGPAQLRRPRSVALSTSQELLVTDAGNHRVIQVSATGAGSVLGSGEQGLLDTTVPPVLSAWGTPVSIVASDDHTFAALDSDRGQAVQVAIAALAFPDTLVGTTSQIQTLTLRNAGTAPLAVSSLVYPKSFVVTLSTCGTIPFQLGANSLCTVDLVFAPSAEGPTSGIFQASVESGAPQRVILTGKGLRNGTLLTSSTALQSNGAISYAGTPLTLAAQVLGSSTLTPSGDVAFVDGTQQIGTATLSSSGQATLTTSALLAGNHTITARYQGDAHYQGSISSALQVSVLLPPDFTMTPSASSTIALHRGDAGAVAFTLQPLNGVLNRQITTRIDGLPAGSTINVTPSPAVLASGPLALTLTFKLPVSISRNDARTPLLLAVCLLVIAVPTHRRRSSAVTAVLAGTLVSGCGGGYLSGAAKETQNAKQTYAVAVTCSTTGVTGDPISHSMTYTVVVEP